MWLTPSSTARRSTSMDRDLSAGTLSPDGSLPGSRIAPSPILLTVRSPSSHVPAAAALITGEFTRTGYVGGCYGGRVSRVHDMGGQTGFGPVPVADDGTVAFHADWEARVYALAAVLRQRGLFNSDELRDAIERLPPAEYLEASYYERWLGAIETLVAEKAPDQAEKAPDRKGPA